MDTTLARPREGLRPRGQRYLDNLLSTAGIEINGGRPYDMRVLDDRVFNRALTGGVEGILDAYVEPRQIRGSLLPYVEVLLDGFCRRFPSPLRPALANRLLAIGHSRRIPECAVSVGRLQSKVVT